MPRTRLRRSPSERREGPVVPVGVSDGEVARGVIGLVGEWVHNRGTESDRAGVHGVWVLCDHVQRRGAGPARRGPLARARKHHPATIRPVELAVMDRAIAIAWDEQVLDEAEREQPRPEGFGIVADDA